MISNPAVHGHSHRGDPRPAEEDARMIGADHAWDHEFVEDPKNRLLQPGEIT